MQMHECTDAICEVHSSACLRKACFGVDHALLYAAAGGHQQAPHAILSNGMFIHTAATKVMLLLMPSADTVLMSI